MYNVQCIINLAKITNVQSTVVKKDGKKVGVSQIRYSYMYSKYCNLIGQLQRTIFCSALIWPGHYFDSAHVLRGSGLATCNLLIMLILVMFSFSCVI